MKQLATLLVCMGFATSYAQDPLIESFLLNTDGQLGIYKFYPGPPPSTTTVNMTDSVNCTRICYDADYVYIRTLGLADYTMGPWEMNPNEPSGNVSQYRIPRNPAEETGPRTANPTVGAMGVAVNGVKLYGTGDARSYNTATGMNDPMGDGLWNGDAWSSEGLTMDDTGGGHPDGDGNYHYHAIPFGLYDDPSATHSPIIGWAFDGFPIYGPYGYTDPMDAGSAVVRMNSSYQLRSISDRTILPDGSTSVPPGPAISATFPLGTYWEDNEYVDGLGDLDTFNGRFCVTPEYPSGIYAYFVTMDASGTPKYPYMVGPEYYGQVNDMEIGGPAGNINFPSSGLTCLDGTSSVSEEAVSAISVYPNPVNTLLYVNGIEGKRFEITNLLGDVVMSDVFYQQIDVSDLETGHYIIRIEGDNSIEITRFIKQ